MAVESTGFTRADLVALEKAIAQGTRRVKYTDKEIEYRSLREMLATRDVMRRELGITGSSARLLAEFDKGLN